MDHLEAALVGAAFIGIGTIIASSVGAQSGKAAASRRPASETACAPQQSPDAMCSLPIQNGPQSRVCFGAIHPRCFELKDKHLVQSMKGATVQNSPLDPKSEKAAQAAIEDYSKWLNSGLAKRANKNFSCQYPVSIESKSERKEFCLTSLPKKEADAKTQALISLLENPGLTKSK